MRHTPTCSNYAGAGNSLRIVHALPECRARPNAQAFQLRQISRLPSETNSAGNGRPRRMPPQPVRRRSPPQAWPGIHAGTNAER